jgi:hypothetical protein
MTLARPNMFMTSYHICSTKVFSIIQYFSLGEVCGIKQCVHMKKTTLGNLCEGLFEDFPLNSFSNIS